MIGLGLGLTGFLLMIGSLAAAILMNKSPLRLGSTIEVNISNFLIWIFCPLGSALCFIGIVSALIQILAERP